MPIGAGVDEAGSFQQTMTTVEQTLTRARKCANLIEAVEDLFDLMRQDVPGSASLSFAEGIERVVLPEFRAMVAGMIEDAHGMAGGEA